MYDKVERKVNEELIKDVENKDHHIKVLLWFTAFLFALIVFTCACIWKSDRDYSKQNKARQEAYTKQHSQLQGWTSKELARVTNMRPIYVVEGKR